MRVDLEPDAVRISLCGVAVEIVKGLEDIGEMVKLLFGFPHPPEVDTDGISASSSGT